MAAETVVNARKERFDSVATRELLKPPMHVIAIKGKKVLRFDITRGATPTTELLAAIIGPSGNLRAPAIRTDNSFVVGFNAEVYADLFG